MKVISLLEWSSMFVCSVPYDCEFCSQMRVVTVHKQGVSAGGGRDFTGRRGAPQLAEGRAPKQSNDSTLSRAESLKLLSFTDV